MRFGKADGKQRFSIKKFSFGAASVLIGVSFLGTHANADEAVTVSDAEKNAVETQSEVPSAEVEAKVETSAASTVETVSEAATSTSATSTVESNQAVSSEATVSTSIAQSENTTSQAISETSQVAAASTSASTASAVSSTSQSVATSQAPAQASVALYSARAAVAAAPAKTTKTATATTEAKVSGKTLEIHFNGSIASNEKIQFAVWTENKGQDDLVWYTANQLGAAYIDLSKHKEYGRYNIHTYSNINGQMTAKNGITIDVSHPVPKVEFRQTSNKTVDVTVKGLDTSITSVSVPVWSDKNDQDDIKWYSATKKSDGSYQVTVNTDNHKKDNGHYSVHIYGQSAITGGQIALAASSGFTITTAQNDSWIFNSQDMKWHYTDANGKEIQTLSTITDVKANQLTNSFLSAIYKGSIDSLQYGVLPSITAAQAILESGWGKSALSQAPNYNLFGIKASDDWKGQTSTFPTQEYINGRYVTVNAAFRKYNSWNESVLDHAKFFTGTAWRKNNYKDVVGELNYKLAAQALQKAGYATDPNYAEKLINIIESNNLSAWDKVLTKANTSTAITTNSGSGFRSKGTASSELTTATVEPQGIRLQYTGKIDQGDIIRFAVWTENKGQDDLIWYQASATGAAFVEFSKHREYGKYNIHTYSQKHGGLNARTLDVPFPQVNTKITEVTDTSYRIEVTNVPNTMTSISLPTWSEANGQDDIKWYSTNKSGTSFSTTVSTPEWGHYNVHVYGTSSVTGGLVGLAVTKGIDHVDNREPAKVTVSGYDKHKTSFTVNVAGSNKTKQLTGVDIAAWSLTNGQDDLKWFQPTIRNNQASQVIDIKNLSNTSDKYAVHVYSHYSDGTTTGVVAGEFAIEKPQERNITTASQTKDGITLSIDSNTISDLSSVRFAVWSEAKGQDDLVWYNASRDGKALARFDEHRDTGVYNIHTYQYVNGQMKGLSAITLNIPAPAVKTSIKALDVATYEVTVSDVSDYITSVSLPTWSDKNGQDDITWVSAKKIADRTYRGEISLKAHNFDTGHYSIHVYGTSQLAGGGLIGLAVTKGFEVKEISIPDDAVNTKDQDRTAVSTNGQVQVLAPTYRDGKFYVTVKHPNLANTIKNIRTAIWSDADQGNLKWYSVSPSKGNETVIVGNIADNFYKSGLYNVHVYTDMSDGSVKGYVAGTVKANAGIAEQASRVLQTAFRSLGVTMGSNEHHQIVNEYNSVNPKPVGYTVTYNDDWCDVFTTVVFQRAGLSHLIGRECGVERHINIMSRLGIWDENDNKTPKVGDIITYNWDEFADDNRGFADHIGIVWKVENGIIHTIEGNTNTPDNPTRRVAAKQIAVGQGQIRGFATPRYI